MIGNGSLVTGEKTMEVNTIYAGHPAKPIRKGIVWKWKGCNQVTEEEFLNDVYGSIEEISNVYIDEEMKKQYQLFDAEMSMHKKTMDERIEFLKQYSVSAPFSDNKRKIKEKQEKENKQENIFYKLFLKIKRKFVV